jgi:hypothetical protein
MLYQYFLYEIWTGLREHAIGYRERPFFMGRHLKEPRLFHCNYEGVDAKRFPSVRGDNFHEAFKEIIHEYRSAERKS